MTPNFRLLQNHVHESFSDFNFRTFKKILSFVGKEAAAAASHKLKLLDDSSFGL